MPFFQTKHLRTQEVAEGVAELILDRQDNAINYLDPSMLTDISRALDAVVKADKYQLLVLRSAKVDQFCHGLPTNLMAEWDADRFASWAEKGQALCAKLAALPMPTVAIIAGSCCDSGLELALACDYRIVVNRPATTLGFPELEWGLVPCWGATQRLPRLTGLENSLHMLLGGVRHSAKEAWKCGLADHLAEPDDEELPMILLDPHKRDWSSFPRRTWRERYLESNWPGRWFLFRGADRILRTRIPDEMPAPVEMLAALRRVHQQPTMEAGLEFERQALARVVEHPALHHLLRLLHHRETMRSSHAAPKSNRVQQLAIIGSGIPALSLLLQAVRSGQEVVLRTNDESLLGLALAQVVQVLQSEVDRGALSVPQFQKLLASVRGTHSWMHFDKVDAVIDTTDGTLADKQAFFQEVETHVPATALLVANPTSFRVAELASSLQRPMGLAGLRIIEPWNRASVSEVVAGDATARGAADRLRDWATALEKQCVDVPDRLGGLVMRVWLPALNEAGLMLREGLRVDHVDQAMRRFGMSFGPFEWMDRLGLDHIASLVAGCQPLWQERIRFETGFALMVEKGWLGNHTDYGFYTRGLRGRVPHRNIETLWRNSKGEEERTVPILSRADSQAWIQRRLVTLMVLEAVRCIEEGVARNANDLDCALCFAGWAAHRGGPIGYGRQIGAGPFAALCAELAHVHGPRFAPTSGLKGILQGG